MGFELTISVMISTDCIGRCTSNYHTITSTTAISKIEFYPIILMLILSIEWQLIFTSLFLWMIHIVPVPVHASQFFLLSIPTTY